MLFLLVAKNEADFATRVESAFPNNTYRFGPGQWVISTTDAPTSKDVWDRIVGATAPTGIIVAFNGYFGRHSNDLWEWIAAKRSAQSST